MVNPHNKDSYVPPKYRRMQGLQPPLHNKLELTQSELTSKLAQEIQEAKLGLSDAAKLKVLETVIRTKLDSGTAKAIERAYEEMLVVCYEVNKLQ